jgi:hypothetical protein
MRTLVLAGLLLVASAAIAASAVPYAGTYRNDQAVIEVRDTGAGQYAGSLSVRDQVIHFTARETAGALVGGIKVDDENVPFRATLDGTTLTFAMEGESHTLTREGDPRAPAAGKSPRSGKAAGPATGKTPAAATARPAPAQSIRINRVAITVDQVRKIEREYRMRFPAGDYWYDKISGGWGVEGGPTLGFTLPGLNLGGKLRANASRGDTGVFINGRELPMQDVVGLQQLSVPVTRGRWWIDSKGNAGVEGNPVPACNIFQFSRGKGGSYQRSTAGGYIGGDGNTSYFFDPKSGSSVMVGN